MKGTVKNFTSLHQKNRPGLLLVNGVLYLGFGSNGCNDSNTGWVLAYDASPSDPNYLQQLGAFNTSPDIGLTSIWQTGSGLAGDEGGNIFASTAESSNYDVPSGGQSFSNSVLELTPPPWSPQDQSGANPQPTQYFSPSNVAYLNSHDQDVSSVGPLVLPDQDPGPTACSQNPCHVLVASGKSKTVYVLDRDSMGGFVGRGYADPPGIHAYGRGRGTDGVAGLLEWHGVLLSGRRTDPGLPGHQRDSSAVQCKPRKSMLERMRLRFRQTGTRTVFCGF